MQVIASPSLIRCSGCFVKGKRSRAKSTLRQAPREDTRNRGKGGSKRLLRVYNLKLDYQAIWRTSCGECHTWARQTHGWVGGKPQPLYETLELYEAGLFLEALAVSMHVPGAGWGIEKADSDHAQCLIPSTPDPSPFPKSPLPARAAIHLRPPLRLLPPLPRDDPQALLPARKDHHR